MIRLLLCLFLLPGTLIAQFAYEIDTSIPVRLSGNAVFEQAWSGGFNAVQVNTIDLNGDGEDDLVLFERTANKVLTYLVRDQTYVYAPEYEVFFPTDLSNFVLLRDLNSDGRKDIFTGNPFGIKVYLNRTEQGSTPSWEHFLFPTPGGGQSNVLLTTGFSGKINLQLQADDLPSIVDTDGDGDLDIVCMNFSGNGKIEYHKNVSTNPQLPDYVRITQSWGGITECGCGVFSFNNMPCSTSAGGRTQHAGGKFLLAIDANNDGNMDLLFSESACDKLYLLNNEGTTDNAIFTEATLFPSTFFSNGLYPAAFFEDVDFDGVKDILISPGVFQRSDEETDFAASLQFYKNTGSNSTLQLLIEPSNFLQPNMIDVGENAVPAFFDYDSDGDDDLFIGSFGKLQGFGIFSGSIYLYTNTGTQTQPVFEFTTDDYNDLSSHTLYNIKPQFTDLNGDGMTDLVFTATNQSELTSLYYILNTTSSGLALETTVRSTTFTILQNENIHLTEIDNDGLRDALLGKVDGAVEYWRNTGSHSAPSWQLTNPSFLQLSSSLARQNPSLYTADLDSDSKQDLLLGDQKGTLFVVSDYKSHSNFSSTADQLVFNNLSRQFENRNLGGRIWATVADLGAAQPAIVVGTMLGGLQVLTSVSSESRLEIFPNPLTSSQPLSIETISSGTLRIMSTTGQHIQTYSITKGLNQFLLPGLEAGVYLLHFTSKDKTLARRLIIY